MKKSFGKWVKELSLYLVLAIVITTAVDIYRSQSVPIESAPDLLGYDTNGEVIDVIEMSHQSPVVVYFWATWCPACKFVSPTVDWVSQYYPVVAVSGASGPIERVEAFKQSHDYQFTNVNDENSQLFREWGISVTPTIFIVKDGKIESVTTGITTPPGLLARLWLNH
ncbi:protein disulfide oxidoreductase [Vibrio sp. RE86]|uniref:protein disulfide oxidoreductase n=1 Tax=Vibrio sp. RE86 TaxID=2607605 RepID=UPI001493786C|nr:protein disulfide oxidoreductase [Vibrio sp. RE86]NOH78287.1 protein disulfide oxidoreductase [Vibrio sp. RE86]